MHRAAIRAHLTQTHFRSRSASAATPLFYAADQLPVTGTWRRRPPQAPHRGGSSVQQANSRKSQARPGQSTEAQTGQPDRPGHEGQSRGARRAGGVVCGVVCRNHAGLQ